jgi:hypothetical protein
MTRVLAIVLTLSLGACTPAPAPAPDPAPAPVAAPVADPAPGRALTFRNSCKEPVWIQQQNHTGSPEVVKVDVGASTTYPIPDGGLASTRYWPKTGCDDTGNNCKMGQSSPPCPPQGCAPPVDSKLEATWGCVLPTDQCTKTPQGNPIGDTFWNASMVDGFTLPFRIDVSSESNSCMDVDCSGLDVAQCPQTEDLSKGLTQPHPGFAAVDLRVAGETGACYSPCAALTYPTFGGKGVQPPSADAPAPYCCPTPPVSPEQCRGGPVVATKYVQAVHAMCHRTAYGFAYDDGLGLRQCSPPVTLTVELCPGVPASPAANPAPVPAPLGGL